MQKKICVGTRIEFSFHHFSSLKALLLFISYDDEEDDDDLLNDIRNYNKNLVKKKSDFIATSEAFPCH